MSRSPFESFIRALDDNGDPAPRAKMYHDYAGTTTPLTVYTDKAMTAPHARPIIADDAGYFAAIYPPVVPFKVTITDENDVTLGVADDISAIPDSTSARHEYATVADLKSDTRDSMYFSVGDRVRVVDGNYTYVVVASSGHTENAAQPSVQFDEIPGPDGFNNADAMGAVGDGGTNDNTALVALLGNEFARFGDGIYLTSSALSALDTPYAIAGLGWRIQVNNSLTGSILKGAGNVADLLTISTTENDGTAATDEKGFRIEKLMLEHQGTGACLKIDHIVHNVIDQVGTIGGGIGVHFANWGFFSVMRSCRVIDWDDTGVFVNGAGSQHAILDCQITSGGDNVLYGVETRCQGTIIRGGQINANRSTGSGGTAVWFNNTNSSGNEFKGGVVEDVLIEADQGVRIGAAGSDAWDNVIVTRPRVAFVDDMTGPIVKFENTRGSKLIQPQLDRDNFSAGTVAEWMAGAENCGVELDAMWANTTFVIDASALDPWIHFTGTMTTTLQGQIQAGSTLRVTVDNVTNAAGTIALGRCVRVGDVWDKGLFTLATDAATSFQLPSVAGKLTILSVLGADNQNRNAVVWYNMDNGMSEAYSGSDVDIDTTNGTLTGTTGAAGKITIRLDSTNDLMYVENRTGSSITFSYHAEPHGPL